MRGSLLPAPAVSAGDGAPLPCWIPANTVRRRFGLTTDQLKRLAVRSVKLGPHQQSCRLYSVPDLEAKLARIGGGDDS